jgi:hypothetical protein
MVSATSESYDSWGIEQASPIYDSVEHFEKLKNHINGLSKVLNSSSGNNRLAGFTTHFTKHGVLIVHVGLPGRALDITTLRYLASIIVIYEDEILRLVPQNRRGQCSDPDHPDSEVVIWSNRENFLDFTGQRLMSIEKVRRLIFNDRLSPDNELKGLINLMGPREREFVNFCSLMGKLSNIEFRQHEGTLNLTAVQSWARFCVGLVELAWRLLIKDISFLYPVGRIEFG